jgi:hypothetical protein
MRFGSPNWGCLNVPKRFPAYRYRWESKAAEPNAYQQRVDVAIEAFGLVEAEGKGYRGGIR